MKVILMLYFLGGLATGRFLHRQAVRLTGSASLCRGRWTALASGLAFAAAGRQVPPGPELLPVFVFAACLVFAVAEDLDHLLILDEGLVVLALSGLLRAAWQGTFWPHALAGALTGGGLLALIRWISRGGLGRGDVKFAGALGFWLGPERRLLCLGAAFLAGGAAAFVLLCCGRAGRQRVLPFGPFLGGGAWAAFFHGAPLLSCFYSLLLGGGGR